MRFEPLLILRVDELVEIVTLVQPRHFVGAAVEAARNAGRFGSQGIVRVRRVLLLPRTGAVRIATSRARRRL